MKPHPRYKASGEVWLGEIPETWSLKRIGELFRERKEKVSDKDFPPLSVSKSGIVPQMESVAKTDAGESRKRICRGDFAINSRSDRKGSSGLSPYDGSTSAITIVLEPRGIEGSFVHHLLRSYGFQEEFYRWGKGIVADLWSTRFSDMRNIQIPLPNESEQTAIANFLDSETAKIDETIKELEASVELLNEEKTSLINEYVTGKINPETGKPYPKYKPSGVEWLGEIPEHWTKEPLRHCINYQEGPGIMAVDFLDEGIPLLRIAGVQGEWATLEGCNYLDPEKVTRKWKHFRLEEGDLLISGSATMGTVTEVDCETVGAVPYTGLIRMRGVDSKMIKPFIKLIVISSVFMTQIDLLKAGATIQHFGPTHLGQMFVVRPPVSEQELIASFLKDYHSKEDSLISEKQSLIETLKEYRTSLIHEAVTGKIDLRNA